MPASPHCSWQAGFAACSSTPLLDDEPGKAGHQERAAHATHNATYSKGAQYVSNQGVPTVLFGRAREAAVPASQAM